ncbi:helix-turn-helix transcriptional regulator [Natronocalculus amylovorans]|uniref:MarR family transcriptional regulator n=1 Tax=Natronocalculus amylovorans TaxID=2917812 RepID=A0AAE3K9R5_9EURY|nr:MarR family transcriptional regulator [Natronocalculus amylovorans]MCL9816344.1 MarR family transcriptional regulator [Natronocalculus amylovorans]
MNNSVTNVRLNLQQQAQTLGITRTDAIEDIAFLTRAPHRVAVLCALSESPQTRTELIGTTDVSNSTIGRTLRAFENRQWIKRKRRAYDTTPLGAFVATCIDDVIGDIQIEQKLRTICKQLPIEETELEIEEFVDAVVTVAEIVEPYRPISRFVSLLKETQTLRFLGVDLALLAPCRDEFQAQILDGTAVEIIDPLDVTQHIQQAYANHCQTAIESGNLAIYTVREQPPYGIAVFDERVAICGYEPQSGAIRILVDTSSPTVRRWAKSTYGQHKRDAVPLLIDHAV